jgi:micrococcal nuclease
MFDHIMTRRLHTYRIELRQRPLLTLATLALALVSSTVAACAQDSTRTANGTATCVVQRVTDGDTLVCERNQRVRLLQIDTPELSQTPFGGQARAALLELAPVGSRLRVELDVRHRDQYGRTLAFLWTADGRMINEEMLRRGMAVVLVYPPNVKYVDELRAASKAARDERVGLWATAAFECSPRDYRAGRC